MNNTPDSPAKPPDDRTDQGGNYWTLFTPGIWKVLHAVLHSGLCFFRVFAMSQLRPTGRSQGRPSLSYLSSFRGPPQFFDKDDPEANQIGAHCAATLYSVVSGSVEEVLHRCAHMPFNATLLGEIFPPPDSRSIRKEKPVAMRAIYDRLTKKGAD